MQFYLCVPLVMFLLLRLRPDKKTVIGLIGVLAIAGLALRLFVWRYCPNYDGSMTFWRQAIHKPLWMNLDLFFGGMLLNFIPAPPLARVHAKHVRAYFAGMAFLWVVVAWITHYGLVLPITTQTSRDLWMFGMPTITLFATLALIRWGERLSFHGSIPEKWGILGKIVRTGISLGELTFGLYVWHVVFIRQNLFAGITSPLLAFACQLTFTLVCGFTMSAITFRGIELPMRSFTFGRKATSPKQKAAVLPEIIMLHGNARHRVEQHMQPDV
jgi:peptidoglycan/LPS O-acetylase OafA/YrhL